jgi:hypothetical protein
MSDRFVQALRHIPIAAGFQSANKLIIFHTVNALDLTLYYTVPGLDSRPLVMAIPMLEHAFSVPQHNFVITP